MSTVDRGYTRTDDAHTDALDDTWDAGYVTVHDAARLLNMATSSVRSAARDGLLRRRQFDGGSQVEAASIEEYLARPTVIARRARDAQGRPATRVRSGWLSMKPLLRHLERTRAMLGVTSSAVHLGVHPGVLHRAMREGVSPFAADKMANAIGEHPALIWGDEWWRTAEIAASMRRHPSACPQPLGDDWPPQPAA